ncbi:CGNR zinc finger domain-containing protein [Leekyejoonella antrihumi]|nr:CGNR zinc finger domain-containing protein [Leekyejoonella antrihumi]
MRRPLTGEPLAVDLINTRWRHHGADLDLLETLDGLGQWLEESGQDLGPVREPVRAALTQARDALCGAVEGRPGAEEAINAVLARGLAVRYLDKGRTMERVLFTDDDWQPAWRAVVSYLDLTALAADGIRRCGEPDCVLYFFDPSGRRRWCSMSGCGNRAKGRRFRTRHVPAASDR